MKNYDVVIIGAGPAGMTAALNCLRAGKSVLVLEGETLGGQIALSPRVENFPSYPLVSGVEIMDKLYEQILAWNADVELESATSVKKTGDTFFVYTDYGEYAAKSVIVASGCKHRHIGVEREEELVGNGVSYCALCDGAFYKGEDVAVIGDANTALQYALLLAGYCKKVHICALFDKLFADKALVDLTLAKDNVDVTYNIALKEFIGEDELKALRFENTVTHSEHVVDCKCAFICVGQVPQNEIFKDLVALDKKGYIIADESCATSCEGVFAAGDCRTKAIRQMTTAVADGTVAAYAACRYIDSLSSK